MIKIFALRFFLIFFLSEQSFAITIGFIPGSNPAKTKEQALALGSRLQEALQKPVSIYISKDYGSLVEAIVSKKVDFAFLPPQTFVQAESRIKLKVLLKKVWTAPYYYSTLVVSSESKISKLADIKGKRIGFVDRSSASGFLYPYVYLRKNSALPSEDKFIFTGNHKRSLELLAKGEVDVVAVYADDPAGRSGAVQQFSPKGFKGKTIWISDAIPNDPFCVRQEFYEKDPKMVHSLMFALVDLMDDKANKGSYRELLGSEQLLPATSKQYDSVRDMVREQGLEPKK